MTPTSDTTIPRPDLGQIVYETAQNANSMGYIGLMLMPYFSVAKYNGHYPVIPKEALFNLLDTSRGPLGHYNRYSDNFEDGIFQTIEHGLEAPIDARFSAIYSSSFNYETVIANGLMNNILRAQESRIANKLFNETSFKTAIAADTAWATVASASPKTDVDKGKEAMRLNGIMPNTLAFNWNTWLDLTNNAEIKTQIFQLFPEAAKVGFVNLDQLKTYFQVENILVAGALYNTKNRGQDTTLDDIWSDDYAILCRVSSGDVTEPSIGRTFLWNEGASAEIITEEYVSDETRSRILRVRHDSNETFLASVDSDNVVKSEISKAAGYLIDVTGN